MSWSLTLDRGKRGTRKSINYNDKKTWISILKEPDEEEAPQKEPEPPKRKRGRPPRIQTPDPPTISDLTKENVPKRRGRPPKSATPVPVKKDPDYVKQAPKKRRGRPPSKKNVVKEESDYYEYVYEYEYEYYDETESESEEEEEELEQLEAEDEEEIIPPVSPPKVVPKKKPVVEVVESVKEEYDMFVVQKVIGMRDRYGVRNDPPEYYVKFVDRSYVHCRWLTKQAIAKYDEGEVALKKFVAHCEKNPLAHSLSIPQLMVSDESDIDSNWFEVERLLHEANDSLGNKEYLCKWRGLEYDWSTLEPESTIHNPECIRKWQDKQKHRNPRKIPSRWVRPKPESYVAITEKPVSKRGEVMKDFQLDGLNWLRKCWYDRRHTILGDEVRTGKAVQAVAMLSFLSQKYKINGPFLVLASPQNIDLWQSTFENWSDLNVVVFSGSGTSRQMIFDNEIESFDEHGRPQPDFLQVDVVLTSYELFLACHHQHFEGIDWRYIIADDGYKMRNSRGRVRILLNTVSYEHMTLLMEWPIAKLVGTQRNVIKVYFLLNFLDPKRFNNLVEFLQEYPGNDDGQKLSDRLIEVMNEYLLDRDEETIEEAMAPKEEILLLCEPSAVQRRMYKDAVKQKTEILLKKITDEADVPLIELIRVLRQLCNHPFLVDEAVEDEIINELGDQALVMSSAKLIAVDKLLPKLTTMNHKVVIFSQMVRVLDILESYLSQREMEYLRIDCSIPVDERAVITDEFRSGSGCDILLLSSKPGSYYLPIDLADSIIIYDNDSYSFPVETTAKIYHLVTNGTYEMELCGPESSHLCFDKSVVGYCDADGPTLMDAQDIEVILRSSIQPMFTASDEASQAFCEMSVDDLLKNCVKEKVADEEAEVSYAKQTKFWNTILEPQKPKKQTIDSAAQELEWIRKLAQGMNDRGYRGNEDELDLLKCALTLAPPSDTKSLETLQRIVGDNSSDEPMKRFGQSYFMVEKLARKFFESVIFFDKMPKALYCATLPDLVWPSVKPLWEDAGCEYTLLYVLAENGYKNLASVLDSDDYSIPATKLPTRMQTEKRVANLVQRILEQFPDVEVPVGFVPMEPSQWKELHPSIIKRTALTDDEVFSLFKAIDAHGVPHLQNHRINYNKLASLAHIEGVSADALEACVTDILSVALGLKSESSEPKYSLYKRAKPLREKVSVADLRRLVLVCRLMEKVYSFAEDFDIKVEPSFQCVKLEEFPSWWTPEHSRSLVWSLFHYGVKNVKAWVKDTDVVFTNEQIDEALPTSESRLRMASAIVSLARGYSGMKDPTTGSFIVKSSANLKIESFGKIVNLPEFRCHNYPYPVGFTSQRYLVRNIPGIPQVWYRCEIQAIGGKPIFVVSSLEAHDFDFAESTPIDAWTSMIRSTLDSDEATETVRKLKLSGDWLFGLTHPSVVETIQHMARLAGVQFSTEDSQSEESDDMDFKA